MPFNILQQQMDFIKEIDKIKYIERRTKLFNSNRRENDAEHSWHLAMMAVVLSEYANEPIDLLKVIKMVLIHDIVEIDTGDIFIYDTEQDHNNTEAELKAANRIFGMLPQQQAEELIVLWQEFEAFETPEAKFAKAIDRLEPLLQNASNKGGTWQEFDVSLAQVIDKKEMIGEGSEELWAYTSDLLNRCVDAGILRKD